MAFYSLAGRYQAGQLGEDHCPKSGTLLNLPCGAKVRVVASITQGARSLRASITQLISRNLRKLGGFLKPGRERREGLVPNQNAHLSASSSSLRPLLIRRACRSWRESKTGGVGAPLADSAGCANAGPRRNTCQKRSVL